MIEKEVYARVGLVGNPSDGYSGKTISFCFKNFSAKVKLVENKVLRIIPSERDLTEYKNMDSLVFDLKKYGYYGGVRLLQAAIKTFFEYCKDQGLFLDDKNFEISYNTNIPRHVGLAGSSAIITAAFKALMEYYSVKIPLEKLPNLVLNSEKKELGISAGLQDRVIQVYGGLVYMDFSKVKDDSVDFGDYERLDAELLPNLFIAYRNDLSEGSEVFHNNIRERFLRGESLIITSMQESAKCAEQVRKLLIKGDGDKIGFLLDRNFEMRQKMYKLSPKNVRMVEIARENGGHAKFTGSGGAVVGLYNDYSRLKKAYETEGYRVIKPILDL